MEFRSLIPAQLPLTGRQLIEASAGTGKTFTIALLYVRLVLERQLMPSQILVVTFTDAATKELRERIRKRLKQAAEVFLPDALLDEDTRALFELRDNHFPDPSSWPACRQRLLMAVETMDEAAISTIHGWCYRMLAEHAFDSGSFFQLELDNDVELIASDAVRDYWRTFFYPLPSAMAFPIFEHWDSPDQLERDVRNLLSIPHPDVESLAKPAQAINEHPDRVQRRLQQIKRLDFEVVDARVHEEIAGFGLTEAQVKSMTTAWKKCLDGFLNWGDDLFPNGLTTASGYSSKFNNFTHKELAKKYGPDYPYPLGFALAGELIELHQSKLPIDRILRHAAAWVERRIADQKRIQAKLGFDDLLTGLAAALAGEQGSELAQSIRVQLPVAMIDEFQDTDPVQYEIFDQVYAPGCDGTLLMIGDPKQAIYSFRGADIFTYLQARKRVDAPIWTLDTNYRSSSAMVNAVNGLFDYANNQYRGAFWLGQYETRTLDFQAVRANGTQSWLECRGGAVEPLTVGFIEFQKGDKLPHLRQKLAAQCAQEIAGFLTASQNDTAGFRSTDGSLVPIKPSDCAVLVNRKTEADLIRNALAQRGIKSVYLSERDSVLQSPVAADLLLWLQACLEPKDPRRLRSALGSAVIGLSWQAMDLRLTDESQLESDALRFSNYRQIWKRQGVMPMLQTLIRDYRVAEHQLNATDGERVLTDLHHLAELLQRASTQLDGEYALVQHFGQLISDQDHQGDEAKKRLESDLDLVQVVTVHKSKGLEYPLVFLPFASFARRLTDSKAPIVVRFRDHQGETQTVVDPKANDLRIADSERLGEDVRKTYVALTRARYMTWVGMSSQKDWRQSGMGYLLHGVNQPTASFLESLQSMAMATGTRLQQIDQPGLTRVDWPEDKIRRSLPEAYRRVATPWTLASYSRIQYGLNVGESDAVDQMRDRVEHGQSLAPSTEAIQTFPRGAQAGTLLHDLLEWACHQGFAETVANPFEFEQEVLRKCTARQWGEHAEVLSSWLLQVMSESWEIEGADTISLAEMFKPIAEMEFMISSHALSTVHVDQLVNQHLLVNQARKPVMPEQFNGMFKGFIDLVFEHQGRFYVMDYKSNAIASQACGYTQQAMAAEILHHRYDLQYGLYTLALHRLLKTRLADYEYEKHMGGAVYWFLRGIDGPSKGIFQDRPPQALIEQLDAAFNISGVGQ